MVFSSKFFVFEFFYFIDDIWWSFFSILISISIVSNLLSIFDPFINVNRLSFKPIDSFISVTLMAFRIYDLSFPPAVIAFWLHLLKHPETNMLFSYLIPRSITFVTFMNIIWIISPTSSTMRTYGLFGCEHLNILSRINIF